MSSIDDLFDEEGSKNLVDIFARVTHLEKLQATGGGAPLIGSGLQLAIDTKTADYTYLITDFNILGDATAGGITITLPTAATSYNSDLSIGRIYNLEKIDNSGGSVTMAGNGAELIHGSNTQILLNQYDSITVQSNGTSWFIW